eukprot:g20982.t1
MGAMALQGFMQFPNMAAAPVTMPAAVPPAAVPPAPTMQVPQMPQLPQVPQVPQTLNEPAADPNRVRITKERAVQILNEFRQVLADGENRQAEAAPEEAAPAEAAPAEAAPEEAAPAAPEEAVTAEAAPEVQEAGADAADEQIVAVQEPQALQAVSRYEIHGFKNPELNGIYAINENPDAIVNGRATYWKGKKGELGSIFMCWSNEKSRWHISPQFASEDLFRVVHRGCEMEENGVLKFVPDASSIPEHIQAQMRQGSQTRQQESAPEGQPSQGVAISEKVPEDTSGQVDMEQLKLPEHLRRKPITRRIVEYDTPSWEESTIGAKDQVRVKIWSKGCQTGQVLKEMTTRRRTDLELMPLPEPWQTGVLSGFERFAPNRLCGSLPALPDLAFPLLAGSPHRRLPPYQRATRKKLKDSSKFHPHFAGMLFAEDEYEKRKFLIDVPEGVRIPSLGDETQLSVELYGWPMGVSGAITWRGVWAALPLILQRAEFLQGAKANTAAVLGAHSTATDGNEEEIPLLQKSLGHLSPVFPDWLMLGGSLSATHLEWGQHAAERSGLPSKGFDLIVGSEIVTLASMSLVMQRAFSTIV